MIYSAEAAAQIEELRSHFRSLGRTEALRNLTTAIAEAEASIEHDPGAGIPAPRPYPELAVKGLAWLKCRRYWIIYRVAKPNAILGVFFETVDIPRRLDL